MSVYARETRGRLLLALYAGRGFYMRLEYLYKVLRDTGLAVTPKSIKAEMGYLESAGFVKRLGSDQWIIEAEGINLVEGNSQDPDPGVIIPEGAI
ncbi:MAG TPA: hypothetical protein VM492_13625 [Sumerlaeia bacterium]|nr:hypothetical protein [Sumerlaeia bacterium]